MNILGFYDYYHSGSGATSFSYFIIYCSGAARLQSNWPLSRSFYLRDNFYNHWNGEMRPSSQDAYIDLKTFFAFLPWDKARMQPFFMRLYSAHGF